ncbi:MAG: carbon storage regulator CsrA [Planctomycetota bacterium]|jgi:carbon storage regulator
MLVLSRCRDESIMIGENVEIIIVDIRGNSVRVGITAPRSVPVHRKEVYNAIRNRKAQTPKTDSPHTMQKDNP